MGGIQTFLWLCFLHKSVICFLRDYCVLFSQLILKRKGYRWGLRIVESLRLGKITKIVLPNRQPIMLMLGMVPPFIQLWKKQKKVFFFFKLLYKFGKENRKHMNKCDRAEVSFCLCVIKTLHTYSWKECTVVRWVRLWV